MENRNENLKPLVEIGSVTFDDRIRNILSVMKQLMAVIDDENKAISVRDFAKIKSLQESKGKLAEAYAKSFSVIKNNKSMFSNYDENKKSIIAKASHRLNGLMKKNEMLLKAGKAASDRVLKIIVESAAEAEQEEKGYYSCNGRMGDNGRFRSALSINQEF